ncbi:MAG: hypothetical protein NTX25_24040 [Proteobacteria bacterium]|nr:hypothetical protein [Pseudomonadota bacterium]
MKLTKSNRTLIKLQTRMFYIVLFLQSCHKLDFSVPEEKSKISAEISGPPNSYRYPLGSGFFSKTSTILNSACISPKDSPSALASIPSPEAELKGGFSESRTSVLDKFNLTVSASANGGSLSGSGAASVDLLFSESDLKTSSYLSFSYRAGSIYLREPEISHLGKNLLIDPSKNQKIINQCGDELIYRVDLGARFHVGIEYAFASKELKDEMKAQLKINGPAGIKIYELNESSKGPSLEKSVGTLNLVVMQEGGDQAAFHALSDGIPKNCKLKIDDQGKLVKSSFEACSNYFQDKILFYAKTEFPKQIKRLSYSSTQEQSSLDILSYYTKRYDEFGFPELQENIEMKPEFKRYKNLIITPFEQELFKVSSFKRSLSLGIGTDPKLSLAIGKNFDPVDLIKVQSTLEQLLAIGQVGFGRCTSLLHQYLTDLSINRGLFSDFMDPCTEDKKSFQDSLEELKNSSFFPDFYKSYL